MNMDEKVKLWNLEISTKANGFTWWDTCIGPFDISLWDNHIIWNNFIKNVAKFNHIYNTIYLSYICLYKYIYRNKLNGQTYVEQNQQNR